MSTNGQQVKESPAPPLKNSSLRNQDRIARTKELQVAIKEQPLVREWDHKSLMDKLDQPALNQDLVALASAVSEQMEEVWPQEKWVQGFRGVHDALAEKFSEWMDEKSAYQVKALSEKAAARLENMEVEITGKLLKVAEKKLAEAISGQVRAMVEKQVAPLLAEATDDFNREFGEKLDEFRQLGAELTAAKAEIERYIDGLHEAKSMLENITVRAVVPSDSLRVDVEVKQLPSVVNVEMSPQQHQQQHRVVKHLEYNEYGQPVRIVEEPLVSAQKSLGMTESLGPDEKTDEQPEE